MRCLTQSELVQALLEAGQPHAPVEVHANVTCYETHEPEGGYVTFTIAGKVVGVRSVLNKVILDVEE